MLLLETLSYLKGPLSLSFSISNLPQQNPDSRFPGSPSELWLSSSKSNAYDYREIDRPKSTRSGMFFVLEQGFPVLKRFSVSYKRLCFSRSVFPFAYDPELDCAVLSPR